MNHTFGRVIKILRFYNHLSQKDLAQKIGASKSYISELQGDKKHPSLKMITELCSVFQIKVWELFFLVENLDNCKVKTSMDETINPKIIAILTVHKEFKNEPN